MRPFVTPVIELGSQAVADVAVYINQLPMIPKNDQGLGVNAPGKYGKRPIMFAAESGNINIVATLQRNSFVLCGKSRECGDW